MIARSPRFGGENAEKNAHFAQKDQKCGKCAKMRGKNAESWIIFQKNDTIKSDNQTFWHWQHALTLAIKLVKLEEKFLKHSSWHSHYFCTCEWAGHPSDLVRPGMNSLSVSLSVSPRCPKTQSIGMCCTAERRKWHTVAKGGKYTEKGASTVISLAGHASWK